MPMRGLMAAVAAFLFVLAACTPASSDIEIADAWARETPRGAPTGAVYATIRNRGPGDDRLIGVETPAAEGAHLHTTIVEGDLTGMRPLESLAVEAGDEVVLAPGGHHVMLTGLSGPLRAGESFPLVFRFEKAGTLTIEADVRPIGSGAHR